MTICCDGINLYLRTFILLFQQIFVYTQNNLEYQNIKFSVWRSAIQTLKVNLYPLN
jgi:hypothetical protein